MLLALFFVLASASELEKCVFDEFNIERALEMRPVDPIDHALKYFVLRRFKKDTEEALMALLAGPENNALCNIILTRSSEIEALIRLEPSTKSALLQEVGAEIADEFFKNKYRFRDLLVLERGVSPLEIRDVVKNVWAGDQWLVSKFFVYIETRDIKLENVIPELEYLAHRRDKQANYLLGMVYLYGIGVEKDLERALEYFWACGTEDVPQALVGIARVYMEDEFQNEAGARNNLEQALKSGANPEASFCLYLLSGKTDSKDIELLKTAAYSGYLPAVYHYGVHLAGKDVLGASNTSLGSVVVFHPEILRLDALAYDCYMKKEYRKAFLIYLFLAEFNLPSAVRNAMFLIDKQALIKEQDAVMCEVFKNLAKTDMKYNKNVGDCYFYGNGVKKSLLSAFSSYLSSRKFSEEGAYNTALMYEHGLGIPQNLYEAKRIITKYVYHDSTYLVRVYSLIRINLKILIYYHYIITTFIVLTAITLSSFVFFKRV